jgi:AraC-like DNA-binding protein
MIRKNSLLYQFGHSTKITPYKRHFHMLYELIYVVSGIIRIDIGDKSYIVDRNNMIFLSNLEEHSITILSTNYERYFLILTPSKLEQLIKDPLLISLFKIHPDNFVHVFRSPNYTDTIMRRIMHEYSTNDTYSEEQIASYIKEILIHLYRNEKSRFPITSKNIKPEIYDIQQYIDLNFRTPITISELADKYFISPYYLSHCFKTLTGYSPKHYLLLTRLSYAKVQLTETFLSIEDIAIKSGFTDANSFIRSFKSEFNITPKQYRRSFANPSTDI